MEDLTSVFATTIEMEPKQDIKTGVVVVDELEEEPRHEDSDSDIETGAKPKGPKVSARRQQVNSAWDDYALEEAKKCIKQDTKDIRNIDDTLLTTRGLINKFESLNIIESKREYQTELFEWAKKENIIAVLPTGSGKTLIAVLLLQHIIEQELEARKAGQPRRLSFFLVEVATLVLQQGSVLDTNLTHPVARFCGEMKVDSWGKTTWKDHFDHNMVIVMTAEILYNCLSRGFITMQEINLLILDEAHHTKKNHAYARIMRDFYECTPRGSRPKIFGTTASPVDAKVDPIQAGKELEKALHSKIATVKNPVTLTEFITPPTESISRYDHLRKPYSTSLCLQVETSYYHTKVLYDLVQRSKVLTAELGEWCGDKWLALALLGEEGDKLERKAERGFAADAMSRAIFDRDLQNIRAARQVVELETNKNLAEAPKLCIPNVSSKFLRLKDILDFAYESEPDSRCIVFVERRATARLLLEIFTYHGHANMRAGLLIGSRSQESGDQKVTIREQLRNMNAFKNGKLNVLFATSVAEEGLDIPLCNLVIRFDLYKTMIQYMQSRGRARHKDSRYVHMLETNNHEHLATYMDVTQQERVFSEFCSSQPPDRILKGLEADFDQALIANGVGDHYTEPSTGAKLAFGTVLGQLDYFAACVPRTEEALPRVEYILSMRGTKFVCEAMLPAGSPLTSIIGKEYSRKSLAKRSAAFEACLELRKRELLDENLLPIYHKELPAMRNAALALHNKVGNAYELLLKPTFWEKGWGTVPTRLFVLVMQAVNPEAFEHAIEPLLMLTRQPLSEVPSFPVYPKPGVKLTMSLTTLAGHVDVSEADIKALNAFTLRVYKDAFNKGYEDNPAQMSYWLAPMNPNTCIITDQADRNVINWQTVDFVAHHDKIPWSMETPPQDLVNRFFVDDFNGGHRYFSLGLDPDLKATDPPPQGVVKKDYMDTIVSWTSSLWKKSRNKVVYNPNQPVLQAYKLPLRRNWLDDWDDHDLAEKTRAWICPEPLRISVLPLPTVVMAYILPALIWRIDAHLVAIEACESLGLKVTSELALEAMTKDSDNTEEHREEQMQQQRGMGKNYERLEFIGDAFLKMATSISLYAGNAADDEFQSHVKRMLMICNRNLFIHAVNTKLYQYIRTEGFNRRTWYPEGLILKEGKGVNAKKATTASTGPGILKHNLRTHNLNDKTIADVCEALIGASLLTERDSGRMDMAVKAVTILVNNPDHQAQCWADYYKQYKMPAYQIAEASALQLDVARLVEETTGYKFLYPRLLASAFTHASWPFGRGRVPCYQRLEFLGDSLLDMACVNFLFYRHPDKDPQWLTEHKMAMVSNKFLGALCVRLGFHKFLKKESNALISQIRTYVISIQETEAASNGAKDYWTSSIDPPKCLPDIVEAYMGAIFVDSKFDYSVVESFFENHVRWFFEDMSVYDNFANNHPTTFVGNLLTNTFNCTHFSIQARELPAPLDGGATRVMAGVMIHFKIIANDICSSSKYAKVRASKKALELLQDLKPEEFKLKFGCDCKVNMTEQMKDKPEIGTAV